jgi:hypothetical protein
MLTPLQHNALQKGRTISAEQTGICDEGIRNADSSAATMHYKETLESILRTNMCQRIRNTELLCNKRNVLQGALNQRRTSYWHLCRRDQMLTPLQYNALQRAGVQEQRHWHPCQRDQAC